MEEQAFNWEGYTGFSNLRVNLVFETVDGVKTQLPANCYSMFKETGNTTGASKISIDLTGIQSSGITSMQSMFWGCIKLETIDVSGFDTSNVTNMMSLFSHCSNLKQANVSGLDTSKVTTMRAMFYGCSKLESVDVSSFDTSNVTNMLHMFIYCSSLKSLDLNNFDTSNVADAGYMFGNCTKLKELKISDKFTLSENTTTANMFTNCNASLEVVGVRSFAETAENVKNKISADAGKVYAISGNSSISESFLTTLNEQLPSATTNTEDTINISSLFDSTSDDVAYIGMNTTGQTVVAEGANKTIACALINKAIDDGIRYHPASLQLTGTITLSGNNSEFNQNSFIVGDGVKSTQITFTIPQALPNTDIIVNQKGKLVFSGSNKYTISHKITFKPGGLLASTNRIILTDGTTIKFEK